MAEAVAQRLREQPGKIEASAVDQLTTGITNPAHVPVVARIASEIEGVDVQILRGDGPYQEDLPFENKRGNKKI